MSNVNYVKILIILEDMITYKIVKLVATTELDINNELYGFMMKVLESCSEDRDIQNTLKQLTIASNYKLAHRTARRVIPGIVKKILEQLIKPTNKPVKFKPKKANKELIRSSERN